MASVAVLSRGSLTSAAICNHAEVSVSKASVHVCPSFGGKKLLVRKEINVKQRRVFLMRAQKSAEAEAKSASKSAEAETKSASKSAEAETKSAPAESASDDSVVPEVANLKEEGDTAGVAPKKKPGRLSAGGTLTGAAAAGKAPADSTLGKAPVLATSGKFEDSRWKDGNWDLSQFTKDGKTDWDAVIDAEVVRRTWLERNPEASTNEDPVFFDTGIVPWWAWVKRFHLPEAEKLNGRAAMVGYAAAWLVDGATGVGLVDQQGSFFGKLLLLLTVVGVLVIRKNDDLKNIKELAQEWTFYDKQWQATWKEGSPVTGKEQSEEKK